MFTRRRAREWLAWEIAAVVTVLALVAAVLVVVGRDDGAESPAASPAEPSVTSTVLPATGPVLAVKIDNVSAARPQTGLSSADMVYVEPVEGGLTRLVAVYSGSLPALVGPVRSARRTDLELLAQYGRPVLAYSGAAPELLPALRAADIVNASPVQAASAFHRDTGRAGPHNLYVRPARLPDGAAAPAQAPLDFGPSPYAGTPTARLEVAFPAAGYAFTWSPRAHRWLVTLDGISLTSTESGRVGATTVIQQQVLVNTDEPIEDAHGTVSPVARTVGRGRAIVLRDGQRFTGTWSRLTPRSPTRFRTGDGRDLPLADGPVWILLTPAPSR